ncbi:T-cell-interacting activating receptor on myeloid cells protein 1-like [Crotalus adamanteus]
MSMEREGVSFVFYQARDFRYEVTPQGDSNMAEFSLENVTGADEGQYTCYYHSLTDPVIWSNASNLVVLKILEDALSNLKGKLSCQFEKNQLNDTIRQTQGEPRGNEGRRDWEGGGGDDVPSK